MFTSATLKLTTWYLINLIVICLIFSFIIFELSTSEISSRLERLQIRVEGSTQTITLPGPVTLNEVRQNQTREARASIFVGLVYMNIAVITLGGFGSYFLARRTLRPIEAAHEAQSRFTSDASHELRTPLAVMKSEIQVALKDPSMTEGEYKKLLKSNLEEVDKLTDLSQSLLQLARLEHGELERADRVDIGKSIMQAAKRLSIEKRTKQVTPTQSIVVDGNQSMLGELFHILLDNAVKYSPKTSEIIITLSTNGRSCKIQIQNEGQGIPKQDLPHIFDRFYRTQSSRNSWDVEGYGLGLSIARKIVSMHDGTITANSNPGKVTSLTVQLPQIRKNR